MTPHTLSTSYSRVHHLPPSHEDEWWRGKDSNLRRRKPADLQSAPVGRLGTPPRKNEPRILVATPRSVNGIGATFATVFEGLIHPVPAGSPTLLYIHRAGARPTADAYGSSFDQGFPGRPPEAEAVLRSRVPTSRESSPIASGANQINAPARKSAGRLTVPYRIRVNLLTSKPSCSNSRRTSRFRPSCSSTRNQE